MFISAIHLLTSCLNINSIFILRKIHKEAVIFIHSFIHSWLCRVFVAMHGLFTAVAVGVYSLAAVLKICIAVTFLVTEHRLSGSWAQ